MDYVKNEGEKRIKNNSSMFYLRNWVNGGTISCCGGNWGGGRLYFI